MDELAILRDDYKLKTGSNTWADIVFEEGSKVKVYPNTEIFLKEGVEAAFEKTPSKKKVLSIFSGKLMSHVEENTEFYINTGVCTLRVNGIVMIETSPGTVTTIAVLEGAADGTNTKGEKMFTVSSGQQIAVAPQKSVLEPTDISATLLNELTIEKEKMEHLEGFEQAKQRFMQTLPSESELVELKWQEALKESKALEEKYKQELSHKTPKPRTIHIDKSITYRGVIFSVASAEICEEYRTRISSENEAFLILNVRSKNDSSKEVFVFYEEEVRLLSEAGETIPLDDYKLETHFDPNGESNGTLLFVIPKDGTKFRLQFGKKSLPKVELTIDLKA